MPFLSRLQASPSVWGMFPASAFEDETGLLISTAGYSLLPAGVILIDLSGMTSPMQSAWFGHVLVVSASLMDHKPSTRLGELQRTPPCWHQGGLNGFGKEACSIATRIHGSLRARCMILLVAKQHQVYPILILGGGSSSSGEAAVL